FGGRFRCNGGEVGASGRGDDGTSSRRTTQMSSLRCTFQMKTGVLTPRGAKTVMRLVQKALWVVAILAVAAWGASAYTSDRMDFGEIDFKGATVSVVA